MATESSYTAFIKGITSRPNLTIKTGLEVDKLLILNQKIIGVEAFKKSKYVFKTNSEVIISAGAIGSPSILMRSGIGDAHKLYSLGIKTILDLPEVGKNLMIIL